MRWQVVESDELDATRRLALRELWELSFGDRFTDTDAEHAYGGVHVIGIEDEGGDEALVTHASAVPRRIRIGRSWREVGYVEAVATRPDRQGRGLGRQTMAVLRDVLARRWRYAFLSTGRAAGFYERQGWRSWQGPTAVLGDDGRLRPTDEQHGGVMVLDLGPEADPESGPERGRSGAAAGLDLSGPLACEERTGDPW